MVVFGPASSVFDLVTFGILLYVFHANPTFFQTGWFLESIVTQTLIIFQHPYTRLPFYRSHPSKLFAASLFAVVAVALFLPYSPVAIYFTFVKMPAVYYVLLGGLLAAYFMLVEGLKQWFLSDVGCIIGCYGSVRPRHTEGNTVQAHQNYAGSGLYDATGELRA